MFYEGVGTHGLEEAAQLAGIDTGIDVEQVSSRIADAHVIIEVGSGSGRAASFIREYMGQHAHLYMVENAPSFVEHLGREHVSARSTLVPLDVKQLSPHSLDGRVADLVLWMFSGISESNWDEQKASLTALSNCVKKGGLCIVDLLSSAADSDITSSLTSAQYGTFAMIEMPSASVPLRLFFPTQDGMHLLASETGWDIETLYTYTTTTGRERVGYVLKKL